MPIDPTDSIINVNYFNVELAIRLKMNYGKSMAPRCRSMIEKLLIEFTQATY